MLMSHAVTNHALCAPIYVCIPGGELKDVVSNDASSGPNETGGEQANDNHYQHQHNLFFLRSLVVL